MFAVDTLDTIAEGSTLSARNKGGHTKKKHVGDYKPARQDSSDSLQSRGYKDPMMDKRYGGHKDSKNKALTVKMKSVHTASHHNEKSHNAGDFRKHVSTAKYLGGSRNRRKQTIANTQPLGCNGPVMCEVGKVMQGVMTRHDPHAPVHAVSHEKLAHGGIAKPVQEAPAMIGAGGAVPGDTPNNRDLNSAAGLHYAMQMTKGAGGAYNTMANKNFMQGMSGQQP